jgi:twitching motility protein PilU
MEKGANLGMQTFDQALFQLYQTGEITLEEALLNADSPNNLRLKIKLASDGASFSPQLAKGALGGITSTAKSEAGLRLTHQSGIGIRGKDE